MAPLPCYDVIDDRTLFQCAPTLSQRECVGRVMKWAHDESGNKDNNMCRSVTGMSLRATDRGVKSRVTSTVPCPRF